MATFLCRFPDCECRFFSLRSLMCHMSLFHTGMIFPDFVCNIDGCLDMYCSVDAYRKHLSRMHVTLWNNDCRRLSSAASIDAEALSDTDVNYDLDLGNSQMDTEGDSQQSLSTFKQELANSIANFRLKTMEIHMLPKSTASAIFDSVRDLMDTYQLNIQSFTHSRLQAMGVDYQSDLGLSDMLHSESHFENVTSYISSDHNLKKFYENNLNLVSPLPIYIKHLQSDGEIPKSNVFGKVLVGHYVPILANLSNYLQHADVWASCQKQSMHNNVNVLTDYTDGQVWRESMLPSDHLRIHLYSDEFEVCNPIGSRKGTHKICAFYYTVGNVDVKYRSQLKNIHLALLLKYNIGVRKYGYTRVMEPLLKDLKILESTGIVVVVDGEQFNIKGSCVTLSGDNLSMHSIGGFNPTFSSGRICRHCMVRHTEIRDVKSEESCTLRSSDIHKFHVQSVLQYNDLKVAYGVYNKCPLSCLEYFDPIHCLPPDLMHDILEGVMVFTVNFVIKRLVKNQVISMKAVCMSMTSFVYGRADAVDEPQPLPEDFVKRNKSISGKAVEKWVLFRMLPLYIGHLVPENSPEWTLYLLCRQICDIVLSSTVNQEDLTLLEVLISRHHTLLDELGGTYFVPKLHYLIHYPRLIMLFGPLRHVWSMRFEANHQYFKQLARRVRNFRNITATLSERYQRKKCCEQAGPYCLGSPVVFPDSSQKIHVKSLPLQLQNILQTKFRIEPEVQCISVRWATIEGWKCTVNDMIIVDVSVDKLPQFMHIAYILHFMGQWIVCGMLSVSRCFLRHYHAIALETTADWLAILPQEAINSHPAVHINSWISL